jgi:hypothetical protein
VAISGFRDDRMQAAVSREQVTIRTSTDAVGARRSFPVTSP